MLADTEPVSLRSDVSEAPAARRTVLEEEWELPAESSSVPEEPPRSRRRGLRWALFLLLPIVLMVGAYFYFEGGAYMSTDDAYIEADKVGLSTDVSGMVEAIEVRENQHVTARQVLFRLDPLPFQLKLDQAQAQLRVVRDNLNALKANYQNVQAQIKQAEDQIAFNQLQYQRQETLARQQFTPQMSLDQARLNLQTSQQTLVSDKAQLASIVANLDGNPDIPTEQHPQYRQALAQRDEAARQLRDTVVRAPYSGTVTNVPSLEPGMYLPASTAAFNLVDTDQFWVEAQPKETELTDVRPGEPATITVDTYPGREWRGTVASIGPAAQSEFSLLPAQNTSGNWVKVVQRIPLRVQIDTTDKSMPPLRAGMSVEVSVYTGHKRGLPHFLTALFGEGTSG
ncbi:MAG TPA: HlyD family secretion protein [Stellaceae bacterium]|jgi:membrane fusion protein (multidrug efflux system)|nr:HlyD family secretion protein [Stellaceae bacterium]